MDKFIKHNFEKLMPYEVEELKAKKDPSEVYYLGEAEMYLKQDHYDKYVSSNKDIYVKDNYLFTSLNTNNYVVIKDDHVDFRYQIKDLLGKGSFGKVFKCIDHKEKRPCALKVIKRNQRYEKVVNKEIDILKYLNKYGNNGKITNFYGNFKYRGHLFLSFQLYYLNMYDVIKKNAYIGFTLSRCYEYTRQLISALKFIHCKGIVHCDLKPENTVFEDETLNKLIIIDFGLSYNNNNEIKYLEEKRKYTLNMSPYFYAQSRYYRAPETHMCLSKSYNIDMWSFGCIMYEMLYGKPIIYAKYTSQLIEFYVRVMGYPSDEFIEKYKLHLKFFNINMLHGKKRDHYKYLNDRKKPYVLVNIQHNNYINLIKACLNWNFEKRITSLCMDSIIPNIINSKNMNFEYDFDIGDFTAVLMKSMDKEKECKRRKSCSDIIDLDYIINSYFPKKKTDETAEKKSNVEVKNGAKPESQSV